jgi:hypothetical protein
MNIKVYYIWHRTCFVFIPPSDFGPGRVARPGGSSRYIPELGGDEDCAENLRDEKRWELRWTGFTRQDNSQGNLICEAVNRCM